MRSSTARIFVPGFLALSLLSGCSWGSSGAAKAGPSSVGSAGASSAVSSGHATSASGQGLAQDHVKSLQNTQMALLTNGMPTTTRVWIHTGTTKAATFPLPGNSRLTVKVYCHSSRLDMQFTGEKKTPVRCSPDGGLIVLEPAAGNKERTLTITPSAEDSVWSAAAWRGILNK